jgi:hypothetical protein
MTTIAVNTKKSSKSRVPNTTRRSEQAVAVASSIQTGRGLFDDIPNELVTEVLAITLESLIAETGSSDQLFLAFHSAMSKIEKLKDSEQALRVFNKLIALADAVHKKSPLYSFFNGK